MTEYFQIAMKRYDLAQECNQIALVTSFLVTNIVCIQGNSLVCLDLLPEAQTCSRRSADGLQNEDHSWGLHMTHASLTSPYIQSQSVCKVTLSQREIYQAYTGLAQYLSIGGSISTFHFYTCSSLIPNHGRYSFLTRPNIPLFWTFSFSVLFPCCMSSMFHVTDLCIFLLSL